MNRSIFTFVATLTLFALGPVSGAPPRTPVTFTSETAVDGDHGEARWAAKIDKSLPPRGKTSIRTLMPADMYQWVGPGDVIKQTRERGRIPAENRWYALTGRVTEVRAEPDGDLHVGLENATDRRRGDVVVEIPKGRGWRYIRKEVFSWTRTKFPFKATSGKKLSLHRKPIITVVGKAFFDVDHSRIDKTVNRRSYNSGLAIWEIHPVMRLDVLSSPPG